jgi:pyrroloquinoline quinone biosynthesis protein B
VRERIIAARPATQECTAISADGAHWVLLNVSADIGRQIDGFAPLHPRAPRDTPIGAILLGNGDLDHCLGLLCLRESQPLAVYATARVERGFRSNVFSRTLERRPGQVVWRGLILGEETEICGPDDRPTGLVVTALPAPGKVPTHLADECDGDPEDNVGFRIRETSTGRQLAYFSSVGAVTPLVVEGLAGADCVFFDGTFWASDELPALGLGAARAEAMAHAPIGGPDGTLVRLAGLAARRRIFVHLNNTNPLLRRDSPERRAVEARGWEVAEDGLEVDL